MNKFAALDDDSDEEQETKPTIVKEKPVKTKKAAPEAPVAAAPAPAPVTNGKTKEKEQNGAKKENAPIAKTSSKAHEKPVATPAAETDDIQPIKDNNRGGRGRGGKPDAHRGRGSRPPRPTADGEATQEAPRRPRREFDRKNTTGRGRGELHRGGRGPFGAGNVKQDALEAEKNPALAEPEIEPVDEPAPVEGEAVEGEAADAAAEGDAAPAGWSADPEPEPQPEAEPEPPTFTLDEYNERQKEARARVLAKVEARPERTVDASAAAYSGLTVKAKEVLGDDGAVKAKKEKEAKAKQEQQLLDVSFKFQAPATYPDRGDRPDRGRGGGRGDRGDRGDRPFSGRGGGGSGGRGSRGPTSVFKMETDFPKLG